jgi:hypothetical protein
MDFPRYEYANAPYFNPNRAMQPKRVSFIDAGCGPVYAGSTIDW